MLFVHASDVMTSPALLHAPPAWALTSGGNGAAAMAAKLLIFSCGTADGAPVLECGAATGAGTGAGVNDSRVDGGTAGAGTGFGRAEDEDGMAGFGTGCAGWFLAEDSDVLRDRCSATNASGLMESRFSATTAIGFMNIDGCAGFPGEVHSIFGGDMIGFVG